MLTAGCSDSRSGAATAASSPTSSVAVSTTTATASPTPRPSGITPELTKAFTTFFNGADRDLDAKVSALQDGAALRTMLAEAVANQQFATLSTQIQSVEQLSNTDCSLRHLVAPCAAVVHDLMLSGVPVFEGHVSHGVLVDGRWLVSRDSWCAIVALSGEACP